MPLFRPKGAGGGGGGGTPSAHASTHQNGGTDEIATSTPTANAIPKADVNAKLDAWISSGSAAATPSLRALGSLATQACAGNDSRLSDARTPTAHAASHASAGSDPLTLAQSQITNLVSDLAGKAASSHTHPASQISDSTVAGRTILTAADATAQRTALGLGTGATLNVPASGNAAAGELVKGDDTRLAGSDVVVAVSYAASITPNVSSGNIFAVGTLTGAITINNPTGTPVDGKRYSFRLNQDGVGGRSISWGTAFRFGIDLTTGDLSTNPNAENRIVFIYNATSVKYEAAGLTRF